MIGEINSTDTKVSLDAKYAHRNYDYSKDIITTGFDCKNVVTRSKDGHFWLRVKGEKVQVCNDYLQRKVTMHKRTSKMSMHPGRVTKGEPLDPVQFRIDLATDMSAKEVSQKHNVPKHMVWNERKRMRDD